MVAGGRREGAAQGLSEQGTSGLCGILVWLSSSHSQPGSVIADAGRDTPTSWSALDSVHKEGVGQPRESTLIEAKPVVARGSLEFNPRGAVVGRLGDGGEVDKAAWRSSRVARERRWLYITAEVGGCPDEYIDPRRGRFRETEAARRGRATLHLIRWGTPAPRCRIRGTSTTCNSVMDGFDGMEQDPDEYLNP
jgi:hypothetical protein